MADYKELLRKAISALPENNGAARRAVYEKARSALVGQLRAIQPPLAAREITQHRLQLEDCIRQVEQEASEAVTLGRESAFGFRSNFAPPPEPVREASEEPSQSSEAVEQASPTGDEPPLASPPVSEPAPVVIERPVTTAMSIEDIIAQAAEAAGTDVQPVEKAPARSFPAIVTRAGQEGSSVQLPQRQQGKSPVAERRSEIIAYPRAVEPIRPGRLDTAAAQAVARQPSVEALSLAEATPVEAALSSVREVEVEAAQPDTSEAEGAISRAIETLDRAARGEEGEPQPERAAEADTSFAIPHTPPTESDPAFASPVTEPRSGPGLTIFLIVFAVLLAGAGGAGFWAWREGYIDLDQMFGQGQAPAVETAEAVPDTPTPTLDPAATETEPTAVDSTGPGNTATTPSTEPASEMEGLEIEDRLEPTPEPVVPNGAETTLPDISTGTDKGEERLPGDEPTPEATAAADDPTASVDPAVLAGSQSLLLEASADGRTGAVPFSGTVEWTEGVDDIGEPTLLGSASIPARNLGIEITIRKNSDPSLPASHLMEVDFNINDTFIGGSIASLPGVLLKDEELVPGTPLVGASARVVGNSFLFALSASEADAANNRSLLQDRRWLDLAVVYGTGRNAIVTLEKDEEAQALFEKVFAAWAD